jgi:hypothetical protein
MNSFDSFSSFVGEEDDQGKEESFVSKAAPAELESVKQFLQNALRMKIQVFQKKNYLIARLLYFYFSNISF